MLDITMLVFLQVYSNFLSWRSFFPEEHPFSGSLILVSVKIMLGFSNWVLIQTSLFLEGTASNLSSKILPLH